MRIYRSWKVGLAAGVMLVSGGCVGDVVGAGTPPPPRPTHLPVLVAVAPARDSWTFVSRPENSCRLIVAHVVKPTSAGNGKAPTRDKAHATDPKRIEPVAALKPPAAIAPDGHRAADGAILARTKRR
jgi:hypothetical protein